MGEAGDPGRLVHARLVQDRGPVVGVRDAGDLALAKAEDVDSVPLEMPPGGGDVKEGTFLRTAHHMLIGKSGGGRAVEQPGDVLAARDRPRRAAGPRCVGGKEPGCLLVPVEDVLDECLDLLRSRPLRPFLDRSCKK